MTTTTRPPTDRSASWLHRIAGWSSRHCRASLLAWLAVLVVSVGTAAAAGSAFRDDHALPGTESQAVADAFAAAGQPPLDTVQVVLHSPAGALADASVQEVADAVAGLDSVSRVSSPRTSQDARTGVLDVLLDTEAADTDPADVRALVATAQESDGVDGLQVEVGGDAVRAASESGGAAEGLGLLAAVVILVPLFGSALAAALPLVTALLAVGSAVGVVLLSSHVVTVPSYAVPMMALVGLGVGIDYALLVFSRFRSELLAGEPRERAATRALDTAGRSVVFAGVTVIVALLGLLVLGLGSLQGLALAVALTVLMTVLSSVTLLPALLALFGPRLERSLERRASRRHARGRTQAEGDRWRRWAAGVQRRPVLSLVASAGVLVLLALPALDLRLGFADASTDSPDSTTRQASDLVVDAFGPGALGPLVVVAGSGADTGPLATALESTSGVAEVAIPPGGSGPASVVAVPSTGPAAEATADLVHRLRGEVLPDLAATTGATYVVGGTTAAAVDFSDAVAQRLPWFIGSVVAVSSLLLVLVFRSVLVPLKAALLNLVSIGAALGVMTFVFGEGNLGAQPGPVEAFLPVIVFAVVFGLSMDYEVFLVTRIHEEWRRTGDAELAVREGLARTGGVITAAAAIMVVVFGAFVASPDRMLQQMGLGLAVAVLVDALVIRCLVVPAVLRLLGERTWWLPRRLDRVLPRLRLEDGS